MSRKTEDENAIVEAHKHVIAKAAGVEAAKSDDDLLRDAKVIEILYRVCRDAEDPKQTAFPGPQWMRDNITTDQLAVLFNLATEVRRLEGPTPRDMSDEELEAIILLVVHAEDSVLRERFYAGCSRESATQACVLLALKLDESRKALAVMSAKVEELKASELLSMAEPANVVVG